MVFAQVKTYSGEDSTSYKMNEKVATPYYKTSDFSFGFSISPTISWFNVAHDDLQTDGATITGGMGLRAEYDVNRLIAIVSGINFNMPGGYVSDTASMNDITTMNNYLIQLYTLDVPLMVKFKTLPVDNLIYYTQGGLSAGFRMASKELHKSSSPLNSDNESYFNNFSNPLTLNFIVGFGATYNTHKRYRIFGEINYKSSMVSIASQEGYTLSGRYPTTPVPEIFSGNMLFTVGVMF
jgi:hypothetical protein